MEVLTPNSRGLSLQARVRLVSVPRVGAWCGWPDPRLVGTGSDYFSDYLLAGTSDYSFSLRVFPGWKGWRVGQLVLVSLSDVVAGLCLQGSFDHNLSSETVGAGKWRVHESMEGP